MNLLIVDDCPAICAMLRKLALELCDFAHVATAGTAADARTIFDAQLFEAVMIDVGLPGEDGFTIAAHALAKRPAARVFVFSGHLNEYTVSRTTHLRLHGFVDKAATVEEIVEALRALRRGELHFSDEFLEAKQKWHADPYAFDKRLTDTERRVAKLIAHGYTDSEVAVELGIACRTAETHRGNILRKLDLAGTPKLIVCAASRGFGALR